MTTNRRARSGEAKQQRREHILDTALELWDRHTFASFSMAEVAASSGLAKGTLYLYFQTKEELFLALLERLLGGWFADLDARLAGASGVWDSARGAEQISATLDRQPALTRLLPIASSILEHNIPPDAARAYKQNLLAWASGGGALLERRMPFLAPGDGVWLLLQIYALVVGLGQMADPAPVVRQVLEDEHMAPLRVEFGPSFRRALETLLRGLEQS